MNDQNKHVKTKKIKLNNYLFFFLFSGIREYKGGLG